MKRKIKLLGELIKEYKKLDTSIDLELLENGTATDEQYKLMANVEREINELASIPMIVYMYEQLVDLTEMYNECVTENMELHIELGHFSVSDVRIVPTPSNLKDSDSE